MNLKLFFALIPLIFTFKTFANGFIYHINKCVDETLVTFTHEENGGVVDIRVPKNHHVLDCWRPEDQPDFIGLALLTEQKQVITRAYTYHEGDPAGKPAKITAAKLEAWLMDAPTIRKYYFKLMQEDDTAAHEISSLVKPLKKLNFFDETRIGYDPVWIRDFIEDNPTVQRITGAKIEAIIQDKDNVDLFKVTAVTNNGKIEKYHFKRPATNPTINLLVEPLDNNTEDGSHMEEQYYSCNYTFKFSADHTQITGIIFSKDEIHFNVDLHNNEDIVGYKAYQHPTMQHLFAFMTQRKKTKNLVLFNCNAQKRTVINLKQYLIQQAQGKVFIDMKSIKRKILDAAYLAWENDQLQILNALGKVITSINIKTLFNN